MAARPSPASASVDGSGAGAAAKLICEAMTEGSEAVVKVTKLEVRPVIQVEVLVL